MADCVLYREHGRIGELVLNRPRRHNSLVPELLAPLRDRLRALAASDPLQAVLLRGTGRSFSTGADVRRFAEEEHRLADYADELVGLLNESILALRALPCPVVCAVQGIVTGGSLGLLLGSDFVVMSEGATITPWYNVVGFSPDGGWTAILPWIIGNARTSDVLVFNRTITASDAVTWGLAARQVPEDALLDTAFAIARQVGRFKPGSIRATRQLLNGRPDRVERRLEAEREAFVAQIHSDEARRGIHDYLAGRLG